MLLARQVDIDDIYKADLELNNIQWLILTNQAEFVSLKAKLFSFA